MEKEGQRILGIKAIAGYLDASERTVYRWEKELGLPLHRVSGTAGSTVYVYVGELEEWLKKKKSADKTLLIPKKNRALATILVSVAILIIMASAYFILKSQNILPKGDIPNPITSTISGNMVFVKDADGNVIRTFFTFDRRLEPQEWWLRKNIDYFDIDGDGANEVVCREYNSREDKFYVTLFNNDGTLLWKRSATNEQTYNGLLLRSNFRPGWTHFARQKDGQIPVISYWRHKTRFLSFILSFDLQGEPLQRYTHSGLLESFEICDLDRDGTDEILFAGTNNLLKGEGVVGVLNLSNFRGVCPPYRVEPEYSHMDWLKMYVPDNPEPGNQLLYLRFKRNPYFEEKQHTYTFAKIHDVEEDLIHVRLYPFDLGHDDRTCCFEYIFNRNFDFLHVIPDSLMHKYYPEIAESAKEDIPLREVTEAYAQSILRWENGDWVQVARKH